MPNVVFTSEIIEEAIKKWGCGCDACCSTLLALRDINFLISQIMSKSNICDDCDPVNNPLCDRCIGA